jgi:hypothetical protein
MQHCYLIQSHREPGQIWRLAARLRADSPQSHIVIAHDLSHCELDAQAYARTLDVRVFQTRDAIVRGEFSMVDAYFHALDVVREAGLRYDWLSFISGQDYPLRSLQDYEERLRTEGYDGYLQFGDVLGPESPWAPRRHQGRLRYYYQYRRLPAGALPWLKRLRGLNRMQKLMHLHTTLGPYVGVRSFSHPFRGGFVCYGGSTWHTLSAACTDYLREARARERALVEYFRRTMSPEEAFVQTVLVNSGRFRLHGGHLRYMDFTHSVGGSPRTLTSADFEHLRTSGCYFARKFDARVDSSILDRLDELASVTA